MIKKEKNIKIKSIIVVIIIMIMFIGNKSYCEASSFSFNAHANKTEVTPGEEIIIEMSVSDIDMGEHGINVVEGFLEYDEDFFSDMELVNESDWKITYNNKDGERKGKFLIAKMVEGVKTEEIIGKIKVRVREDITEGESQLKIKKIQSNDGENLIDEGERIITIRIKKKEENRDVTDEPNIPQNTTPENTKEEVKEHEMKELENADTGDNIMIVIVIIAGVVVVNIVVMLLKRRKEKEIDNKNR